jgi:hypothetical protein
MTTTVRCAGLCVALLMREVVPCAGQVTGQLAPCPHERDTLSLLQPTDSAFTDAKSVVAFLNRAGFAVRCVTRSIDNGLANVGKVAGFQTTRGTITVFFVPPSERFQLSQVRTANGYRLTYTKAGSHPSRTVLETDMRRPFEWIDYHGWYFEVTDSSVAADLRRAAAVAQEPRRG